MMTTPQLITTQGIINPDALGLILPYEHIFVDLKKWHEPHYAEGDPTDVIERFMPIIRQAKDAGVTAIVECSPIGVGRRVDIDKAVSDALNIPIIVPTGIYREPWIPDWVHKADETQLYEWMLQELSDQVESTGVRAAWIKLSAGDDGITDCEAKVLRAAARAAKETNALIGSHTIRARVVKDQLKIIEEVGYTAERFLWIHTQAEDDITLHLEIAQRGAWLEYDWIGGSWSLSDEQYIERIRTIVDAGYAHKLLLSHDQGWHDLTPPNIFRHIPTVFIPKLEAAGLGSYVTQLTHDNPVAAFSR